VKWLNNLSIARLARLGHLPVVSVKQGNGTLFIYLVNLLTLTLWWCVVMWHRILAFAVLWIMLCSTPVCLTRVVCVSVKYINVSAKLVVFSFWVYTGSSEWGRNSTTNCSSFCVLGRLAPWTVWRWRALERGCGGGRSPGGGGEALHPSLPALHAASPHPLALAGLGLRSWLLQESGATEHLLWTAPACLGYGSSRLYF